MPFKSSNNSYYRYIINNTDDLSNETLLRRKIKKHNNHKRSFAFEVCENFENFELLNYFLKENLNTDDILVFYPEVLNKVQKNIASNLQTVVLVNNISDTHKLDNFIEYSEIRYIFNPTTKDDLNQFYSFAKNKNIIDRVYWRFKPYNSTIPKSLTIGEIANFESKLRPFPNLEIHNTRAPEHYEFCPIKNESFEIKFKTSNQNKNALVSIIIPTFNNKKFLSNVLYHLLNQRHTSPEFEIIIADDGSDDGSCDLIKELYAHQLSNINFTYIYWSKNGLRGNQNFFRAGLIRNIAAAESGGKYLLFLDSDMIVPDDFVIKIVENMSKYDVIQFQRFHINQEYSHSSPLYKNINIKKDTYIEEERYWSQLFFTDAWESLPQYWKYTCTYALGIHRQIFFEIGMFKKYYISYGFEDTDLGYECHLRGLKFNLVKTPLFHLTAYDKMQYKNSAKKRIQLLRITAELFYLQHLNKEIYSLLIDFYRFQKPIKSIIRDIIT